MQINKIIESFSKKYPDSYNNILGWYNSQSVSIIESYSNAPLEDYQTFVDYFSWKILKEFQKYISPISKEEIISIIQHLWKLPSGNAKILLNQQIFRNAFLWEKIDIWFLDIINVFYFSNNSDRNRDNKTFLIGDYGISYNCDNQNFFFKNKLKFSNEVKKINFSYHGNLKNWDNNWELNIEWLKELLEIKIENLSDFDISFESIILKNNVIKNETRLILNSLHIGNLEIQDMDFQVWNIEFRNLYIENLKITNSNLWKLQFNGVVIWKLTIENVTLNDCIFNWVDFKDYTLWETRYKWWDVNYKQMKDNYRQLKFVMDKNWNHTEANKFYEKEMEMYSKDKKIDSINTKDLIQKMYDEKFSWITAKEVWEIIWLRISENISTYWSNWIRPWFLIILFALFATLLNGISNLVWDMVGNNIVWDIIVSIIVIFSLAWDFYKKDEIRFWILDKILKHFYGFIFLFIIVLIGLWIWVDNFNSLQVFAIYINPIWFLPDFTIIDWQKHYITYNWIELLAFVLYKIIYGILLWHLIVAAKRTTRR